MRYRMTAHASEQAQRMGVSRSEVVRTILHPVATWPADKPDCTMARGERLTIPYNHVSGEVITVLWTSTEWLPDRHLPPQEQTDMSGWINLDAKEAERLLEAWGFIVKEDKGTTKLWTHPADPEARLIPFSAPGTGRANGRGSYRAAAQALDMSVHTFVKGPTARARIASATLAEVAKFDERSQGPDPLGLVQEQRSQLYETALTRMASADAMKRQEQTLTTVERAAYEAVQRDPLTASEVGVLIERGKSVTNDVLNRLQRIGLVVSRMSHAGELGEGRTRLLYLAGPAGTEIPLRPAALLPDPIPTPVVVAEKPEEAPVSDTVIQLTTSDPVPERTAPQLFQRTEIKWPTGGIVIQDEDGNLYVARPLVEGK